MRDEVTSRRVAVSTLNGQMEQLLKQSSSELTAEQTDDHGALKDDVQQRLNTVSIALNDRSLIQSFHLTDLRETFAHYLT